MRWHHFHLWEFIVEALQQRFKAGWNKVFQKIALSYIFPGNTRGKYEWRWPRSALLTSPLLAERQWVVFGTWALHTHRCEVSIPALLPPPLSNFRSLGRELKAVAAGGHLPLSKPVLLCWEKLISPGSVLSDCHHTWAASTLLQI